MTIQTLEPPTVRDLTMHLDEAATALRTPNVDAAAAIVSVCEELAWLPDPLAFLAAGSARMGDGVFWQQMPDDVTLAGIGVAREIVVQGPARIAEANAVFRELRQRVITSGAPARFPILGGFAFGDEPSTSAAWRHFPGGRLVVPRLVLQIEQGKAYLRINLTLSEEPEAQSTQRDVDVLRRQAQEWLISPLAPVQKSTRQSQRSVPDIEAWQASVASALGAIDRHTIDKVVLARAERISTREPISAIDALRRAQSRDAQATLFAMQSGTSWFFGATPERLVRLADERVDVTCLAGSVAIGGTQQEQEQLAQELLASAKNREEHEIVVCAAFDALEPVCRDVRRAPGTPRVVTARAVQHLETRVNATLPAPSNVLDLVDCLHPTPAVGGYPQEPALAVMRGLETIDRGWYAGPFGWIDLTGSGEFAVAIRSAVVDGATASLFAGCGIVAGSDPRDELAETELKLQPMRAALGLI